MWKGVQRSKSKARRRHQEREVAGREKKGRKVMGVKERWERKTRRGEWKKDTLLCP